MNVWILKFDPEFVSESSWTNPYPLVKEEDRSRIWRKEEDLKEFIKYNNVPSYYKPYNVIVNVIWVLFDPSQNDGIGGYIREDKSNTSVSEQAKIFRSDVMAKEFINTFSIWNGYRPVILNKENVISHNGSIKCSYCKNIIEHAKDICLCWVCYQLEIRRDIFKSTYNKSATEARMNAGLTYNKKW